MTDLAIEGGKPIFPDGPPNWPVADDDILNNVQLALAQGTWGLYDGPWTEELAAQVNALCGCEHNILCSSGTIAVEIALRAADVKSDSEVILAAYDFPGNFRAIEAIGARPVIVDVVAGGWVLDVDEVGSAITEKTSAVIASHLHGQFVQIEALQSLCKKNGIVLVEDACQVPGGTINDRPAGSFGDVSVFSFGGSKLLTAGRGGAVCTNDADLHQRAKIYCNRGNEAFPISQLQAAALLPQFAKLGQRNEKRRQAADDLIEETREISVLSHLTQVHGGELQPAYYKVPWLIDDVRGDWTRDEFIRAIQAEGIPIDIGFRGFTRRSNRRCRQQGSLINARIASQQTVVLHHPILLESESVLEHLAMGITKVINTEK